MDLNKKIILSVIRRKFALNKNQLFRFKNQRDKKGFYCFSSRGLEKIVYKGENSYVSKKSNVSLNHLLSNECEIILFSLFIDDIEVEVGW